MTLCNPSMFLFEYYTYDQYTTKYKTKNIKNTKI